MTRGTIETDLIRRDFTFNAMAIRLDGEQQGELIDLHDGESDLRQGLLRVLHDRSFEDDPTRLFRGARFEQRFGFAFADDTLPLIPPALPVIDRVSGDRIRHELELIFGEAQPLKALAAPGRIGHLAADRSRSSSSTSGSPRGFKRRPRRSIRFTCWVWLACRLSESSLTRFSQRVNLARADAVDLAQVQAVRDAAGNDRAAAAAAVSIYRALADYHDRSLRAALTVIDQPEARAAMCVVPERTARGEAGAGRARACRSWACRAAR